MSIGNILYNVIKIILLLTLPFIILIKGAVWLHDVYEYPPYVAILGGALGTSALLALYFYFIHGYIAGRLSGLETFKQSIWIAMILVGVYSINGLLFISAGNTKTQAVQEEFTSLHPILRLSVSTIVFLDSDLIITDAQRRPEDYRKMGLPSKRRSLHYKQKSGYVHALDIRVNNRTEFRNTLLKWYFQAMGFNVLRHGGTGDHLHISLTSWDLRGAI